MLASPGEQFESRGGPVPVFAAARTRLGLIAVLFAALVYIILAALTGSAIVAIVGAILVLLGGIPSGRFGFGSRWGGGRPGARW